MAINPSKPIFIVDPLPFPKEKSQDLRNCRQQAAEVSLRDAPFFLFTSIYKSIGVALSRAAMTSWKIN
jgi:hypothetical protein